LSSYENPDKLTQYYLRWYHQAEKLAKELGYVTYNFENEISYKLSDQALVINELDGHPSPALNKVYAEKMADHLINLPYYEYYPVEASK